MDENTTRVINDNPDSIEIGTPAKGGCMKVYGNFMEADMFKKKIKEAAEIRKYAQEQTGMV